MTTPLLSTPPSNQRDAFLSLTSPRDVARLLDYRYSALIYQLYKIPDSEKYEVFEVPKKSGGKRIITSPSRILKLIQRRLAEVLENTYKPKPVVYGFVTGKNIVDNARRHKKKKWVLNIDLEAFFPSINFGRVRGMFIGKPYNLPADAATILAQICCFKNELPQGAPTSPVISNMICAKMDSELQDLAWSCRCFYTRYADDITFSTTLSELPVQIATVHSLLDVEIGPELENIISANGFKINPVKTRAFSFKQRQEVTGLIVNKKPNVRRTYVTQIRAMLYSWEKHGLEAAEAVHNQLYAKHRHPNRNLSSFKKIVREKIEFLGLVKGKDNKTFQGFKRKYHKLILQEKGLRRIKSFDETNADRRPRVYTEGVTDAMILQTAWKKLYPDIDCPFIIKDCNPIRTGNQKSSAGGADVLKNLLRNLNEDSQIISVGIFDRDDAGVSAINDVNNYIADQDEDWKISVQRKSGCFALPTLPERERYADNKNLCIEFYFDDDVLASKNSNGRGLSMSIYLGKKEIPVEDDPETSRKYPELRKIKDDGGKMIFAKEIVPSLPQVNFEPFRSLFDKVLKLIEYIENAVA